MLSTTYYFGCLLYLPKATNYNSKDNRNLGLIKTEHEPERLEGFASQTYQHLANC